MLKKIAFCACLAVKLPFCLNAQEAKASIYETFDKVVGLKNTVVFNGIESLDLQKSINENNMFLYTTSGYTEGSLVYDEQFFPKIRLKFNVVDDHLLVQIPVTGGYSSFQLITSKVESFTLENYHFQKLEFASGIDDLQGFYEQIFMNGEIQVFKKYRKKEKKRLDKEYIYYEYYPDDPDYFLAYRGKYYPIKSKRDIIHIFPEFKKEIKQIYTRERSLHKNDPDAFMKLLSHNITNLQN